MKGGKVGDEGEEEMVFKDKTEENGQKEKGNEWGNGN